MGSFVDQLAPTEHHLYPRSRLRQHLRQNTVMIPRGLHQAWHLLVYDATPEEALTQLVWHWLPANEVTRVDYATRNDRGHVRPLPSPAPVGLKRHRAFELVFPTQRPLEIIKLWAWQWVPTDYVSGLSVRIKREDYIISTDFPDTDLIAKIKHRQHRKLAELQLQKIA